MQSFQLTSRLRPRSAFLAVVASALAFVSVATFTAPTARAAITVVDSNYTASSYYTHTNSDAIVSFDWDGSGSLYYQTSTSSYTFGGFYKNDGTTTTTLAAANANLYSGASVVRIGDSIYYNASTQSNIQRIYRYSGSAPVVASITVNYSLAAHNGSLFITGTDGFGPNKIYYSAIGSGGTIAATATTLGQTGGSSGPLTFDSAGNLYYAFGYGTFGIYKWSAAEVAAAIADPIGAALSATGHLWLDYSTSSAGATSMVFDSQGTLLITLTDFSYPSQLLSFGVSQSGDYLTDSAKLLLTDDGRLGDLRNYGGTVYLASDNGIFAINSISAVPEPATYAVIGGAFILAVAIYNRRRRGTAL